MYRDSELNPKLSNENAAKNSWLIQDKVVGGQNKHF